VALGDAAVAVEHSRLCGFREKLWHCRVYTRRGVDSLGETVMTKSNFVLRLQPLLLDEARKLAEAWRSTSSSTSR
jgi:hypothetical protein